MLHGEWRRRAWGGVAASVARFGEHRRELSRGQERSDHSRRLVGEWGGDFINWGGKGIYVIVIQKSSNIYATAVYLSMGAVSVSQ